MSCAQEWPLFVRQALTSGPGSDHDCDIAVTMKLPEKCADETSRARLLC